MLLCSALLCPLGPASLHAQSAWSRFWAQPPALRNWAITHPFALKNAQRIAVESLQVADSVGKTLDNDGIGGWMDAFRHAYWMACTAHAIGPRRAKSLGQAYERGNYQDFKHGRLEDGAVQDQAASTMDLANNAFGIALASRHPEASPAVLRDSILSSLASGQLYHIKKDAYLNSLDAAGNYIPTTIWQGVWKNQRMVVRGSEWPQGL
jgi:hypothetical protein